MIVRSETSGGIATITLDSPANRNALSRQLVAELADSLTAAAADAGTHGILLTHTGPAFCSGAALDEMRDGDPARATPNGLELFRQLLTLPVPVVAQVDGAARAGGIGLLACCDVVLASARSTFAFTEVRLGLAPAVISLPLRAVLTARGAARYFLTSETFDAATAAQIGLVTAVGDDAEPVLAGLRRADRQGLAETRPLVTRDRLRAIEEDGPAMTELSARLFASPVAQTHLAAFLASRLPCRRSLRLRLRVRAGPAAVAWARCLSCGEVLVALAPRVCFPHETVVFGPHSRLFAT